MGQTVEPLYLVKVTNYSEVPIELRFNRKSSVIPPNGGNAIVDFHAARIAFGDPRSRETEITVYVDDIKYIIPRREDELKRLHVRYGTYYDLPALQEYVKDIEVQDIEAPQTVWTLVPLDPNGEHPYDAVGVKPMTEIEALRNMVLDLQSKISDKSLADLPMDTAVSPRRRGRPPVSSQSEALRTNSLDLIGVDSE